MDLDEFSDDGLDDLPDNALQELEDNAIQFTQAHTQQKEPSQQRQTEYPEYVWVEDDDLDTTEVTNETGVPIGKPTVDKNLQQQEQSRRSVPPLPNPRWNPTVDPASRPNAGIPARPRMSSVGLANEPVFGSQRFQSPSFNRPQSSQFARAPVPQNHLTASQTPQAHTGGVLAALQQRVRALEAELNAARGEASIIRSNHDKAKQEHNAEVSRLKRLNAEQIAKKERIVEAAVAAEKSASTELQFLQRDMREVNDRARRKELGGGPGAGTTTPKKAAKTWGMADGFDEMDLVASPSKGQGRSRNTGSIAANVGERTPSKGKRKRPVADSPIMPLEIQMDDRIKHEDKSEPLAAQPLIVFAAPEPPFEFLQIILDHSCFYDQPPTFDVFTRFAFPDEPKISFAAIIFHRLPLMGNPHRPMQLLVDFAELIISMWVRCLDSQLWEPIKYLVSLLSFTFNLQTITVAPLVLTNLSAVAQETIYTVAENRHRMPDGDSSKSHETSFLEPHINTTEILSLLYTAALACATTFHETDDGLECSAVQYWRYMRFDLVLLLLTPKQRLDDMLGMLDLLATSSVPSSIGPIMAEKEPPFVALAVIERVSSKLVDFPPAVKTPDSKRRLRLTALRTLIAFARHPFGATQLASHSTTLPRLVTCLSTSIDDLYDQPALTSTLPKALGTRVLQSPEEVRCSPSGELCHIISQCVSLIHLLVTGPHTSNIADIGQKLSAYHGGSQRYLLALGRLTFAEEDLVIEAGIDGEIVEAAHELLEMAVTPDEGEIISEAFGE